MLTSFLIKEISSEDFFFFFFSNTHFAIQVGHQVGTHSDFVHDLTMKIKVLL